MSCEHTFYILKIAHNVTLNIIAYNGVNQIESAQKTNGLTMNAKRMMVMALATIVSHHPFLWNGSSIYEAFHFNLLLIERKQKRIDKSAIVSKERVYNKSSNNLFFLWKKIETIEIDNNANYIETQSVASSEQFQFG